ncbi:ankyrin repeat domain-containing protein [Kordia sp.]|uniref:ankyrin repeat domain-containing protein n=1 Tax=Kordia sp. TaxID=1965332 RepID=UPI003D2E1D95
MKTIKIKFVKTISYISLALLLGAVSCTSSGEKTTNTATNVPTVEAPKMDIQSAVLGNNLEVVKQHIKAGTDINTKDAMTGSTPLITAVSFGKKEIAKALIDAKADLSIKNNDGSTALHSAAFFCETELVQMLIDAGADQTVKNNFGATAKESVMGPFEAIKPIYEMLQLQLAPMGLEIDLNHIEKTRPIIASMLK